MAPIEQLAGLLPQESLKAADLLAKGDKMMA